MEAQEPQTAEIRVVPEKRSFFRRMYDWVVSWAERPQGPAALFGLSLAESSFFPIPPDPLLIALCLGAPKKSLRFAVICTAGSVIGGIIGYLLGWAAWSAVSDFFFNYVPGFHHETFERVRGLYAEYDFWAIFVAGLTPIPYKVFTLTAGVFAISFPIFIIASITSRGLRFFLLAGLIYRYGPEVNRFIEKYFDMLAWLFLVLLVGGFFLVKVVF